MEVKFLYQRRAVFQQSLPRISLDRSSPTVSNLSSKKEKKKFKPRSHFGDAL